MSDNRIKENILGLAHIGVMVSDLEVSKKFYSEILGMDVIHENSLVDDGKVVKVAFMQVGDMVLELILLPEFDNTRKDGYIDHIAFNVKDIEVARKALEDKGIKFVSEEIAHAENFFDNGAKWILFRGPDGEHLEINEIL